MVIYNTQINYHSYFTVAIDPALLTVNRNIFSQFWNNMLTNIIEPRHEISNNVLVRPAKAQISLRVRTVWSEPLLVAWVFYDC